MRTIGLLGGMSYHSTADYYLGINDAVAGAGGGHASAPLLLSSLDFSQVRALQVAENWEGAGRLLGQHARLLADAGAEAVVICTNLMHKVAPAVEAAIDVPLLHIVDAVADEALRQGIGSLGVMGAHWTMTEPFYAERLSARGITTVVAEAADVALTDSIIWDELTQGIIADRSREALLGVAHRICEAGAEGVVLGCTELPSILSAEVCQVPVVDSTRAHVRAAAAFVLQDA